MSRPHHSWQGFLSWVIALSFIPVLLSSGFVWATQQEWFILNKKDPPTGDNRGGARGPVCAIAPLLIAQPGKRVQLWTTQPLFVWQGPVQRLEVRTVGKQPILWTQRVTLADQQVLYLGPPLQPSKHYTWVLFDQRDRLMLEVPFTILPAERRRAIATDLKALTQPLQQLPPEEAAKYRANYFVGQQLWSDAFQEAFSVLQPSAQLTTLKQAIIQTSCQ